MAERRGRDLGARGTFVALVAIAALLYVGHLAVAGVIAHPITYGFVMLFVAAATFTADYLVDRGILERDMLIFYYIAVAGIVLLLVGALQKGLLPLAYTAPLQEAALGSAFLYAALVVVLFLAFLVLFKRGTLKLPFKQTVAVQGRFVKRRVSA